MVVMPPNQLEDRRRCLPSRRTSETATDRSAECLENVCWRLRKPVTVITIELVEV